MSDLLGESVLLSLGFQPCGESSFLFETIEAKRDLSQGIWLLGTQGKPDTSPYHSLKATDIVAFCHEMLAKTTMNSMVESVRRLLPKAIVLRQMLRLSEGGQGLG